MPGPNFKWKTYTVPALPGDVFTSRRTRNLIASEGSTPTVEITIPDLADWPHPIDKARMLLETAAEVEHALLVQYLYAAFSLKNEAQGTDPGQRTALDTVATRAT